MKKNKVVSISVAGMLFTACGGATPPAEQPAPVPEAVPEAASEDLEPATAEPVTAPAAEEKEADPTAAVGELTVDSVRLVIGGKAVPMDNGYGIEMTVTATTDPSKQAWLFGMHDGLFMSGKFGHIATAGAGGGSFREGGSTTSIHVKGAQPVEMKRSYPRSNEGPIKPGTTLNVKLETSICPQKTHGSNCNKREIAGVVLTVTASGEPTVRIKPAATQ